MQYVPGCGAAHFALLEIFIFSGVRFRASLSAQMSVNRTVGTRCTANFIPISQHSATDHTSFELGVVRQEVARGATDWSRCQSCARAVSTSDVSLEHDQRCADDKESALLTNTETQVVCRGDTVPTPLSVFTAEPAYNRPEPDI